MKATRFTAVHGMKRYSNRSRKLSKFSWNFSVLARAPTRESSPVNPAVMTRTSRVGLGALERVRGTEQGQRAAVQVEAQTEMRPSAEKMRRRVLKMVNPADCR